MPGKTPTVTSRKMFRGVDVGILKRPEFADVPKQPATGDMLQYLGIVKNHGEKNIKGFSYRWRVNDSTVKTGVYEAVLEPQQQAYVWYSHPCPPNFNDHRDQWLTLRVEAVQSVGREQSMVKRYSAVEKYFKASSPYDI